MKRNPVSVCYGIALLLIGIGVPATGDAAYVDDIGYTMLVSELGAAIPDGTGVSVVQVEAAVNDPVDCPSPNNAPCAYAPSVGGRTITDGEGGSPVVQPFSPHAGFVGERFYGDTSTTPGIGVAPSPGIAAYEVSNWQRSGLLQTNTPLPPAVTTSRVANHSYIAASSAAFDLEVLRRSDWLVETDEYIQVAGFAGGVQPVMSSALNAIVVDPTNNPQDNGSVPVAGDAVYAVAHTRPDLVAPEQTPSNATPRVASAAAFLIDSAHSDPLLSNGSTTNRNADTIYNAERSEVVKAALMAGAERATNNTSPEPPSVLGDITDYRADMADRTGNGLDRRYGAGQLNIFNSYHIIAAGEQDSDQDDGVSGNGLIGIYGFDYDPAFGGQGGNSEASYFLPVGAVEFTASLVWNIAIDPGPSSRFDQAATLYDLDLSLYEVIDPGDSGTWVLIGDSTSTAENTENIWVPLVSGRNYALQVTTGVSQTPFNWDYGLAWRITVVAADADVPNIVDQAQATAEANIVAAGLRVGAVTGANSNTVPAGDVISQNPTACTACVVPGSAVDLVVSAGAAPVDVPSIVGQAQATAQANIVAAGLTVGVVTMANSNAVPAGEVISQNPTSCTGCVAAGSAVDLVVSAGPAPAASGSSGGGALGILSLGLLFGFRTLAAKYAQGS